MAERTEKNIHVIKAPSLEYDKEYWKDVVFQWADSNFPVQDQDGNIVEAGTVLRLRNKIEFLHHLTDSQLKSLRDTVVQAVDHELSKRK